MRLAAMFDVKPVSDLILNSRRNFLTKFVNNCDNVVCGAISIMAKCELDCLAIRIAGEEAF